MSRRNTFVTLVAVISSLSLVSCRNDTPSIRNEAPSMLPHSIGQSGESFPLGEETVSIDFGYIDDGDKLVYAIIRSWPIDAPVESRLNDPRYDLNPGGLPRVRHPDGQLKEVSTNGMIYMFFGDQLRTMQVAMDEHTDTVGISGQKDLEGIWNVFAQFKIPEG